jgi:hypothetical protein
MKKKYKCMSCCKEVSRPKSFGGVDGHCRPGDLVYNNNDLFAAIENADDISAEIVEDNRQSISESNVIGCEYLIVIQPYQSKKRIGSKVRYGKYVALIIDNKRGPLSNHKIRIIRELTNFEKLLLIIKKEYKDILYRLSYGFSKESINSIRRIYHKSKFDAYKYVIIRTIDQVKYRVNNEDFSYRYDNR